MQAVDFNHVPHNQAEIHARLENWARWQRGGHPGNVHPMFRQYRARNAELAPSIASEVDGLDAVSVQKVMKDIPERQRLAVQWCYVQRNNPNRMCAALGVNKASLLILITEGRTMITNRLTVHKTMCINTLA